MHRTASQTRLHTPPSLRTRQRLLQLSQSLKLFGMCTHVPHTGVYSILIESFFHRAWREKQAEEIAKRDEASEKRKQEIIEKAEKAIDDFYATYNQKKEKQIAQNKEDEAAFVQARDDALAKGTTWERIADLIELQDSRSKTVARGSKDLSRMKEVLLSLKRDGEAAPNAAGY